MRPYSCISCGKCFKLLHHLRNHLLSSHHKNRKNIFSTRTYHRKSARKDNKIENKYNSTEKLKNLKQMEKQNKNPDSNISSKTSLIENLN